MRCTGKGKESAAPPPLLCCPPGQTDLRFSRSVFISTSQPSSSKRSDATASSVLTLQGPSTNRSRGGEGGRLGAKECEGGHEGREGGRIEWRAHLALFSWSPRYLRTGNSSDWLWSQMIGEEGISLTAHHPGEEGR
jgi:hypothetical protein